jgi:hypothetical protein
MVVRMVRISGSCSSSGHWMEGGLRVVADLQALLGRDGPRALDDVDVAGEQELHLAAVVVDDDPAVPGEEVPCG